MRAAPEDAPPTLASGSQPLPYDRPPDRRPPARPRWWVWVIVVVVLGAGGYFLVPRIMGGLSAKPTTRAGGPRAIPVVVATAHQGDLPIYLNGLGTVTPYNTYAVRSRVDGQIVRINFSEGQFVKSGDLLIQIDPRPYEAALAQAQGQLLRDQALLANARVDLERYQSIKESVTEQQIRTQQALVNQYQGTVQGDQGQVASADLNVKYCNITAPIGGRIGLRQVDIGNMVHATDTNPLATITQLQPITVIFPIAQQRIASVFQRPDHGQGLAVDAWSEDFSTRIAAGRLLTIDNQVDPSTGTVKLKAVFANENFALFPSEFVNARLLVDTLRGATIVPSAAVQFGPDNARYAYVVGAGNKVELRNVKAGPTEGDETAIDQGIKPGDVVVIAGVDKLQNGTEVSTKSQQGAGAAGGGKGASTRPASGAGGGGASRRAAMAAGSGTGGPPPDTRPALPIDTFEWNPAADTTQPASATRPAATQPDGQAAAATMPAAPAGAQGAAGAPGGARRGTQPRPGRGAPR